jgi:hypothetical protein
MMLLLIGCIEEVKESDSVQYPGYSTYVTRPNFAGWDPFSVVFSLVGSNQLFPPILLNSAGQQLALKPLSIRDKTYAFVADPPLSPGLYTISGTTHLPFDPPVEVEIKEYGADPSFVPESIAGTTWKLEPYPTILLPDTLVFYSQFLGDTYVEISSVTGNEVGFRIVTTIFGSEDQCELLKAKGTVDEDGEFLWSIPSIDAQTDQETLHLKNTSLHWGWSGALESAYGVEGFTELDTRALDPYLAPDGSNSLGYTCGMMGGACYPCDSDGEPYCGSFLFHSASLSRSSTTLAKELPLCGFDLEAAQMPVFDFGCEPVEYDPICAMIWIPFVGFGIQRSRRKATSSPGQPTS